MQLVRESLYEKFTEYSDPITDLGIGGIPSKIKKLFNYYFSKYGKLDFKFDDDLFLIYVFIPYKNRKEREEIQNMESNHAKHIIGEVMDILQSEERDLWSHHIYKSRSFKNKNKFHIQDRGLICKIMTAKLSHDPEAEW
jgi:hypothetical protein